MISRLIDHLRTPLYRNGYSLVISSMVTSGLGIIYWILAARLYSTDTVGLNSAVLSAIFFLSNIAQLNLVNGLNRFLPAAGERSRRLILNSYLLNVAVSVVGALIFIAGVNFWTPKLAFVASSPLFILIFVLFTAIYGIFALQDSALIGIRQAIWVPFENLGFAILKILFLVPFVILFPAYGILGSWLVPLGITMIVINLLLFKRLVPRHIASTGEYTENFTARHVASYVAYDYLGGLFWVALVNLQPVIITQLAGPTANAFFFLSWQIAYSLYLISRNMGSSLIAEVAADPAKLRDYSWRTLMSSARLILPAVLVIVVGAHFILHLFGEEYAEESTLLLQLLALSAIPQLIIGLYLSIARIQRNLRALILVQAAMSLSALALIFLFIGRFHLAGVGLAWVISQSLVAAYLMATSLRGIFVSHINISPVLSILDFPRSILRHWKDQGQVGAVNRILPQINRIATAHGNPLPENCRALNVVQTVSEVTVVSLGQEGRPADALLKLATSQNAVDSLQNQVRVISALCKDTRLDGWAGLLPQFLAEGRIDDQYFLIEKMIPGIDARRIIFDEQARTRLLATAVTTICELHARTAATMEIDDYTLRRWVDDRLQTVRQVSTPVGPLLNGHKGIDRLSAELHGNLAGKKVAVSWIHGDYFPGNILTQQDGSAILGIVDWDLAAEDLPMIDIMHLLLSTRILLTRRELGDIVSALMDGSDQWTEAELALLQKAQQNLPGQPVDMRSLLLLTWLRHISSNLTKASHYANQWLWVSKNIETVLGIL